MATNTNIQENGLPDCFANPEVFQPLKPRCDECAHLDACGHAIEELVRAIQTDAVPSAAALKRKLPRYESALCFWDPHTNFKTPSRSIAELESHALKVINQEHRKVAQSHNSEKTIHVDHTPPSDEAARPTAPALASRPIDYEFPTPDERGFKDCKNEELSARLNQLLNQAFKALPAIGYASIREELCAIHVEMNLRQEHAPRFRPTHKLPRKPTTTDGIDEGLDRQVIDLHWRAHAIQKPRQPIQDFEGLFDSDEFDFDIAARFAMKKWGMDAKVTHLHLSDSMQWEHAVLQSKSIREKWRTIVHGDVVGKIVRQRGKPQIEALLQESAYHQPHLQKHIPYWLDVWTANAIAHSCGPKELSRIVAIMTGKPGPDPSAVSRAMKALKDRIDSATR